MNILVCDSWLREYLKTKATPKQIAKYLSLCSQSVEKVIKKNGDLIYEIEITTNRADCPSVYGIARELAAILPRFGIKADLQKLLLPEIPRPKKKLPLKIKISNPSLCPRFTALIFDNTTVKPSPKIVQDRLEKSGIRTLNNVVDISNYLMLELGQPMHTFDYDKIKGAKMTLRESRGGEEIITLDKEARILPDGVIVIEDGEKRLIDLCGIMGGKNSAIDEKTEKVLLFVQTYNPIKIRQACQQLAFRTEAANRFEKGVNPEGAIPAIKKATAMFKNLAGAKVASKLVDIYPKPEKKKSVALNINYAQKFIGVKIPRREIIKILESLGFKLTANGQSKITFSTPHWRYNDISIPEDLIEEVARIYGYFNLPGFLPEGRPLLTKNTIFDWENRTRKALKFWGFTETASYSMVSSILLQRTNFNSKNCLEIANPLTKNLIYMRPSLIPSLVEIISQNQSRDKKIKIFELANIYLKQKNNQLPKEVSTLAGAMTGDNFYRLKGIVEALFEELGIKNMPIGPAKKIKNEKLFHPNRIAGIGPKNNPLGFLGEVSPEILQSFAIENKVVIFALNFDRLAQLASNAKTYKPISKYPAIVEDLSFLIVEKTLMGKMIHLIKSISPLVQNVKLVSSYKNIRTFRITYHSCQKTLRDSEVKKIREKILQQVEKKLGAKLKQKV